MACVDHGVLSWFMMWLNVRRKKHRISRAARPRGVGRRGRVGDHEGDGQGRSCRRDRFQILGARDAPVGIGIARDLGNVRALYASRGNG